MFTVTSSYDKKLNNADFKSYTLRITDKLLSKKWKKTSKSNKPIKP